MAWRDEFEEGTELRFEEHLMTMEPFFGETGGNLELRVRLLGFLGMDLRSRSEVEEGSRSRVRVIVGLFSRRKN